MNDIKVYIKVDPIKGLPEEPKGYNAIYLTSEGLLIYEGNNKWYCNNSDRYHKVEFWLKEISLTELMAGFAEWARKSHVNSKDGWIYYENGNRHLFSDKELMDEYLKSKGIVL